MKTVEVLLREHVDDLGRCGDVVKVAPGYARNYLLPYRKAVPATADNKRQIARRAARLAAEDAARAETVAAAIEALSKLELKTTEKADENGSLYGSVTAQNVAELATKAGQALDEKSVRLEAPIKTVGTHAVTVHVHGDQTAEISVVVEAEA